MDFPKSANRLTLRGARHLLAALFGAFTYFYVAVLQYERIANWLSLTIEPWQMGVSAAIIAIGLCYFIICKLPRPLPYSRRILLLLAVVFCFLFCLLTSPSEREMLRYQSSSIVLHK